MFRKALEVSAAAWAAVRAQKKDIIRLQKLLSSLEKTLEKGVKGFDLFYATEDEMHRTLVRTARNPLIQSVLTAVYDNYPGYNLDIAVRSPDFMKSHSHENKEMTEAVVYKYDRSLG